jgi:hypothetical protein
MPKKKTSEKGMVISFILDETGSMTSCKDATIEGYNEYIKSLQKDKEAKKAKFTLTKFNSEKIEIVHNAIAVKDVPELNNDTYMPDHMTPLYDAIGKTIKGIEKATTDENVLVIIQTDGYENHSKEYDRQKIYDMIEKKQKDGWTFAFLGADIDAYAAGMDLGISKRSIHAYSSSNTRKTFGGVMASATINYASTGGSQTSEFFEGEDDENKG